MGLLEKVQIGGLSVEEATAWMEASGDALAELMDAALWLRISGKGKVVTYSRKVFAPLTTYCRDDCGYCTFKRDPGQPGAGYLDEAQVLKLARDGAALGCKEVLFSLGDKPELRFPEAAQALRDFGQESTIGYLKTMCARVLESTGLLPHPNPGTMGKREVAALREHSPSMGLMTENLSPRLRRPGWAHDGAPDKAPRARLATLRFAGELRFPFTTGLLIGIGETPLERVESLFAIREMHARYGHVQEIIIQNFRTKADIPMRDWPDAPFSDLLRTIAVARLIMGPSMNLQAPPNLSPTEFPKLLAAGINDWGGISPLTPDHINPEAPWPQVDHLRHRSAQEGFALKERLCLYPEYIVGNRDFLPDHLKEPVLKHADAEGYAIASQ